MGIFPFDGMNLEHEEAKLHRLGTVFAAAPSAMPVQSNIQIQRWSKLVWNVAWNVICTLTMVDMGTWLTSSPEALVMTERLMEEVIAVAAASGVILEEGLTARLIAMAQSLGNITTSMQLDARDGNPLEVRTIIGVPVERGRELGVPTPTLDVLYALILATDAGLRRKTRITSTQQGNEGKEGQEV